MKKIKNYSIPVKELIQEEVCMGTYGLVELKLREVIKQAQIDTIEYAVKRCAEEAEMTGIAYGNDESITDYEVDRQSILNVADKIKEELNDSK